MPIAVSIDGVVVAPEAAHVSVFDRGFLYGDSVFETVRTYGGRPHELDAHLDRLERSAGLVFISMPVGRDQLRVEIDACLAAAGNPESYLRVMITRGQGALGLDPALADNPRRVILCAPLNPLPAVAYSEGVAAITWRTQRSLDATGHEGAKIGNYLVSVLALREAKAAGAHEALITNGAGEVLEGATSNLFFVKSGTLLTPPLEAGILAGITRATVLECARALEIPLGYCAPSARQLLEADEVFISSTIRELVPVVRIDGAPITNGLPGPITLELLANFRAHVSARG